MPGIGGVETLRRIRKSHPDLMVYVQTAFHREYLQELVELRREGIPFEVLSEPLDRRQIIHITRGILEGAEVLE